MAKPIQRYAPMFSLALIPLVAAISLACGIIYYYFLRGIFDMGRIIRMVRPSGAPAATQAMAEPVYVAPGETEEILRREVSKVRKLAAELNKGRLDVEWSERQLEEKSRKLDMLITKAEETLRKAASTAISERNDNYSKAGMLLELGLPAEEIKNRLGLLSGELELIETLESYRSDKGAGPVKRKKTPHREVPSHPGRSGPLHQAGQVA